MAFLDKLFGNNDSKVTSTSSLKWNQLTELKHLDEAIETSGEVPVLLFKHSTRCAISRMALKSFEQEYSIDENEAKPYFLDLLEHRNISNEIAERLGVMHQSPQLIVVKNGKAVYHASHSDISANMVKEKI